MSATQQGERVHGYMHALDFVALHGDGILYAG